jgi:hypothetical protein
MMSITRTLLMAAVASVIIMVSVQIIVSAAAGPTEPGLTGRPVTRYVCHTALQRANFPTDACF